MVIWVYIIHPGPLVLVVKQVTSGHGSFSRSLFATIAALFLLQLVGQKESSGTRLSSSRLFPGEQVEVRKKLWGGIKASVSWRPWRHFMYPLTKASCVGTPDLSPLSLNLLFLLFQRAHHCSLHCGFCHLPQFLCGSSVFSLIFAVRKESLKLN